MYYSLKEKKILILFFEKIPNHFCIRWIKLFNTDFDSVNELRDITDKLYSLNFDDVIYRNNKIQKIKISIKQFLLTLDWLRPV